MSALIGGGLRAIHTLTTGTVGQPTPADLGTLNGEIKIYNYKPVQGNKALLVFEFMMDVPVPNAHFYSKANVTKAGTIVLPITTTDELPPAVKNILSPPNSPRTVSLSRLQYKIVSPKPPKGHAPFFTFTREKNLGFSVRLEPSA